MTIGVFAANGYCRQTAQRGRSRALMNTLRSDFGRRPLERAASERVVLVNSREGEPDRCERSLARPCTSLVVEHNSPHKISFNW